MKSRKSRWLIFSTIGLVLTGMGLCLAIDASILKESGAPTINWVVYGTGALVVFNSGISVFGQAIIERIKLLNEKS